ncbi:MAG: methylenetetrahydrofolate reductase [NAD(P)H] [Gammaproteobacteria bacterium]|nr:methylenetetrahydrofolate reductase [NAD(P)H] [Gammaproteobacteria bacterium]MCP4880548.1 methylenetetrahydrofolate reductase [NAD(P)H] [Gammaproteobacteria bacterium]
MQYSFEFFPPRGSAGNLALDMAVQQLLPWQPAFASMTYGAGGTSQLESLVGAQNLINRGLATAAHLTCVDASQSEVQATARQFIAQGVDHFVALRGDSPSPDYVAPADGYAYASDLVAGLRQWFKGTLSVAAYPEVHPEAKSALTDLQSLKIKLDAGADQIITQYCYDSNVLLDFAERLQRQGVTQPLLVGVMPIHDIAAVQRFSARCGASVPQTIVERFEAFDQSQDMTKLGIEIAFEQCQLLLENGFDQFHFYTLNRSPLTSGVLSALGAAEPKLACSA